LKEIVVFQESFLQSLELAYEQEQSVERIGTGPELTRIENNVFSEQNLQPKISQRVS
jgi:hypothetical protein